MLRYTLLFLLCIGSYTITAAAVTVEQIDKLTVSDSVANDHFGWSVTTSGETVVVGSYLSDGGDDGSGSAYVYTYDALTDNYAQAAKLTASDAAMADGLGISVAISGDTVVVGAYLDNGHGSAYVFEKPLGGWSDMTQTAKLTASNAATSDSFGYSVAINGDTVVVGAYGTNQVTGSAYVFEKSVSGWGNMNETAILTASDAAIGDEFGKSVSISSNTMVVGASRNDDDGTNSGSAYVFERPVSGWDDMNETAKLTASDAAMGDSFGISVAISGDTVIVGAILSENLFYSPGSAFYRSGSAYVFEKPVSGWATINESAELTATDGAELDKFGQSVAISGDTIVVGAYQNDDNGSNSGSAYVFEKPTGGWWADVNENAKLIASDAADSDLFGYNISISGEKIVVGADQDDDNGSNSGSAYVFKVKKPTVIAPIINLLLLD